MGNERKQRPEPAGDEHVGVRLKKSLRRRLKILAAHEGKGLQEILDGIVEEHLKNKKQ